MRAWQIGAFGLDHLALVERPLRDPGPLEVRLRLLAASLNYRDLMVVKGQYNPRQALPLVPGSDGAFEVVAVGAGVTRVKVGDRVAATFFQGWSAGEVTRAKASTSLGSPLDGTFAEEMIAREEGVVRPPAHFTDEEVATLPCAAVTAWNALVTQGGLAAGDVVLVQGTGGVSIFALQIAVMHGARVIVTSSSDAKLARARDLGAHHGINYRTTSEWGAAARKLTDGVGVDHVIEVGGAGTLEQSLKAVRPGGIVDIIGVLSGSASTLPLAPVLMQNIRLQGVLVGSRETFEDLVRALTAHEKEARTRPVVDRVFSFAELPAAFAHLESGAHFGKVVVRGAVSG